jgi:hypothetical protein
MWTLIPEQPFSNVSSSPNWVIHPMRGSSANVKLTSRITQIPVATLEGMPIGSAQPYHHGIVRRSA